MVPLATNTVTVYASGSRTDAASSSSTLTLSSPVPSHSPPNKATPIALGVAIPVTVLLVCALSFLYIRHERKKLARQPDVPVVGGLGQQQGYKGPIEQAAGGGRLSAPVPVEQQWYGGYQQPQQVGGGGGTGYPVEAGGNAVYRAEAGVNVVHPVEIGGR
ncbi:hypothetical protein GP486_000990 [Trichoglossum hirsutum]|uniref:Uncharacterized protein n=1 Tax=Trichoglossum hirsutum TaxID=265104 RepID=A0A9P8LHU8_9PEZI|nr:hypothetical protein GP486_000990 [Trichoglossum hirsutum]